MITSEEIKSRLWDGATELRGSMDASRYKDYMLGLMFYKFLSDKTLETFRNTAGLGRISESELVEEYTQNREELGEELDKMIQTIYDQHFEGFERVESYLKSWQTLIGEIDELTYNNVLERLKLQLENARNWRDQVNTYFYRMSGIPDEIGREIYR